MHRYVFLKIRQYLLGGERIFLLKFTAVRILKTLKDLIFHLRLEGTSGAQNPPFENEICYGEDLRTIPIENI